MCGLRSARPACYRRCMSKPDRTTNQAMINAALEEFRALYQLAVFRLSALDQRLPLTVGTFSAVLISVQMLPEPARMLVLWATPPALVWLMRATVNHARSFEDALRRIEHLEQRVNELLGEEVLGFQSHHPSRGKAVGGRTGREAVIGVEVSIVLLLITAVYQVIQYQPVPLAFVFSLIAALVALLVDFQRRSLSEYSYMQATAEDGINS